MESALSSSSATINVTFDGNDVLNKIRAQLNQPTLDHLPSDLSFEKLRDLISNQSDDLTNEDYRTQLSDVPFLKFDAISIAGICLAYAIIMVVSLLGNILVCYVIIKLKRMHTVTNLFIFNLAVSDLLISCVNIPFSLVRLLMDDWPLGQIMCQFLPFVQVTAVYVSSWTMVCIAYDRLRVIVLPLRPRLTFRSGAIMITTLWVFCSAVSAPYAIFHQVVSVELLHKTTNLCAAMYPTGQGSDLRQYLSLGTFILQFIVPLNITGFCYGIIALNLWSTKALLKASGSIQNNHMSSIIRNRQKTIKMLVLVLAVFAGTWLPISMYHLTRDFNPQNDATNHNVFLFMVLHWLAMSSSGVNPGIYCCWNQCYRVQAVRLYGQLVFRLCCCRKVGERRESYPRPLPQVQIEGLIVRFSRNRQYSMDGPEFSQRSFNWDSVNGVKEVLHLQEGRRFYSQSYGAPL
ncbi:hypothetical protein RvY_08031-1 [Ramazzottius varieornatus]|uniref:G-protein coupled receptors family 1 profile domain-containing protein n=1 Tax=Ramazzottius varieornatus TaxID=947166 RepID=A0A1D1V4B0_RAMVA|nr:hypothetical protein RvY_08031-1 [Ramazzottius varieornatus]